MAPLETVLREIDGVFEVFDHLKLIAVSGGEPLLHPDIDGILKKFLEYAGRFECCRLFTNGSIVPAAGVMESIAKSVGKLQLVINDYGCRLSVRVDVIKKMAADYGFECRINKYSGDGQHCEGWVDYGPINERRGYSAADAEQVMKRCHFTDWKMYNIFKGKLFYCTRAMLGDDLGFFRLQKDEYLDLTNASIPLDEKRKIITALGNKPLTSCYYCNGFDIKDSVRYPAAEQLKGITVTNNVFNSTRFIVVLLSTLCNLKCKNCLTFTPHQARARNFPKDGIKSDIARFFQIFDAIHLEHLDFGGGEPLLHPDLVEIVKWTLDNYGDRITQLRVLTNGTIKLPEELLTLAKDGGGGGRVFFLIDDYGEKLSPNAAYNAAALKERGIPHRVNVYHGSEQYFGGWIDFGDLSYKNYSGEQLEKLRLECSDLFSESPISQEKPSDHLHIKDGKIFTCDIQQVGAKHIPLLPGEYVDLRTGEDAAVMREHLLNFKQGIIEHCKYCTVFRRETHPQYRVPAAIQFEPEELSKLKGFCE
jgi:organic radical activating enzyme